VNNIVIDIKSIYGETAKLDQVPLYVEKALVLAGSGNNVELTGAGPVWLYLIIAHALHGKVKCLTYSSPVTGPVQIFNHDPY
jgi:hypothetical protein